GSDHAPHTLDEKAQSLSAAPAGLQGVETIARVMVHEMLEGRLAPERLATVLSEGTARLYGLHPRKGSLEPGADGDFTLVDPTATSVVDVRRLHSLHPQTPWHGRQLRGAIRVAILRGEVIARDGEPVGEPHGRLVRAEHGRSSTALTRPHAAMLAFTRELDQVISPEVMPATVFEPRADG
ncbi:MAG TPA: dihydroorotase family protein, partial [Chloroflexota bacterium]|nr:dihydroorotase family protein [Chloroflexota bacterium]